MHRMLSWLFRLWRGRPSHVDKHDPNPPWSDPGHDVVGDVQAWLDAEKLRGDDTCDAGPGEEFETNQLSYLAEPKPEGWLSPDDLAKVVTDRDLMSPEEQALWADIEGDKSKHPPIAYPAPAEQTTQEWVTSRLEELTGGLTRHPMDMTNYPTPPNEVDKAMRAKFNGPTPFRIPRAMFSHGYSMRYLGELKARAERKDMTLSAEELMGLRARGLA